MALYTFQDKNLSEISRTTFSTESILERDDLQAALRDSIEAISPDTLVISEEFSDWSEGSRRIDLLGLDKQANLVVIELKRDETGAHMELQALRYAAMVSTLTFTKAIEIYQTYLVSREIEKNAQSEIMKFLDWNEPLESQFAADVKIVLASANFSKELTTAVMWLNKRKLDIRCVRLQLYKFEDKVLLDVEQIIPLPEAENYQVKVREQLEEQEKSSRKSIGYEKDYSQYLFQGKTYGKRRLVLAVVHQYLRDHPNISFEELKIKIFPDSLQGVNVIIELENALKLLSETGYKRYFLDEDEILLTFDNYRVAVSNQWGIGNINNFIKKSTELGYIIKVF